MAHGPLVAEVAQPVAGVRAGRSHHRRDCARVSSAVRRQHRLHLRLGDTGTRVPGRHSLGQVGDRGAAHPAAVGAAGIHLPAHQRRRRTPFSRASRCNARDAVLHQQPRRRAGSANQRLPAHRLVRPARDGRDRGRGESCDRGAGMAQGRPRSRATRGADCGDRPEGYTAHARHPVGRIPVRRRGLRLRDSVDPHVEPGARRLDPCLRTHAERVHPRTRLRWPCGSAGASIPWCDPW